DAIFEEAAAIADLPLPECTRAAKAFETRLHEEMTHADPLIVNIYPRLILPPVAKYRLGESKIQAKVAMLRAALVFLIDGQEEFAKVRDPFGSGPFGFQKTDHGFQLTSALKDANGRSVRLDFGAFRRKQLDV